MKNTRHHLKQTLLHDTLLALSLSRNDLREGFGFEFEFGWGGGVRVCVGGVFVSLMEEIPSTPHPVRRRTSYRDRDRDWDRDRDRDRDRDGDRE